MKVGYARTSTIDQVAGFEGQRRELEAAGCERIFAEQTSSIGKRSKLDEALAFVRQGDTLIVTRLDRLARSVAHLSKLVEQLEAKGVALKILSMGLDTSTSNGRLMLNVFGAVAQFEREVMLERQREGIAKAKGEGKYKGRAPTARAKSAQIIALANDGVAKERIAKQVGVGVASVYRVLAGAQKVGPVRIIYEEKPPLDLRNFTVHEVPAKPPLDVSKFKVRENLGGGASAITS